MIENAIIGFLIVFFAVAILAIFFEVRRPRPNKLLRGAYTTAFWICFTIALFTGAVFFDQLDNGLYHLAHPPPQTAGRDPEGVPQMEWRISPAVVISGVTCFVTTLGALSTMVLAWRLDRRQSREMELRIAQLQSELQARARQNVDQT
jgi:hypothetical protein